MQEARISAINIIRLGIFVLVSAAFFASASEAHTNLKCLSAAEQADLQRQNVQTLKAFGKYNFPAMQEEYRKLVADLARQQEALRECVDGDDNAPQPVTPNDCGSARYRVAVMKERMDEIESIVARRSEALRANRALFRDCA